MNELLQDLLHLDISKSTGTDNIGLMILKVSAPFIVSRHIPPDLKIGDTFAFFNMFG
jgi:hypothetical protein